MTPGEETTYDSFQPVGWSKRTYSLLKVSRYSIELTRDDISSSLEACLTNAFLLDLQHMGLLHLSINLINIIDKSKIDREKARSESNQPLEGCLEL